MTTLASQDPILAPLLNRNQEWATKKADPGLLKACGAGQAPKVLWIGCADSRCPEAVVTESQPGEVFVHRNIANTFKPGDPSATAVLAYAIQHLGVTRVVVVGHTDCGGVKAAAFSAADKSSQSPADRDEGTEAIVQVLEPLRNIALGLMRESGSDTVDHVKLVEANVAAQVSNVAGCSVIKKAWEQGKDITVDGWVYEVGTGKLRDLDVRKAGGARA